MRISDLFKKQKKVLVTYITAGDPKMSLTKDLLFSLCEAGADIIELGIPFSDPIADGPVIQRAMQRALKNRISISKMLELVEDFKKKVETPIIIFGYYNPIYQFGVDRFFKRAKEVGVDGVLFVDVPPEEDSEISNYAKDAEIERIYLLSPTSTLDRIKLIKEKASGFVYYISVTGVTGKRERFPKELEEKVRRAREILGIPVCVGFGVKNRNDVLYLSKFCDGVVVGSAIVEIIEKNIKDGEKMQKEVKGFVKSLKSAFT